MAKTIGIAKAREGFSDLINQVAFGGERYVVERRAIVTRWDAEAVEATDGRRLTLITCYPFGGLRRSDLRYVVTCRPAPARMVRWTRWG